MEAVVKDYSRRLMMSYKARINNPKNFFSIDKTSIYMNCHPKHTVHLKLEKTVSTKLGVATSYRITLVVSVTIDVTNLPLFVIFLKGSQASD